jgi:hypothetical protein
MLSRIFIFFCIINFLFTYITSSKCEEFSRLGDNEIIKSLKLYDDNFFKENYKNCIEIFIRTGHLDALEYLLNYLIKKQINFKDELNRRITDYNNFLLKLKNKFTFKETNYQKATPAVKWAQNKEFIFLEIKFSHRHDAPGIIFNKYRMS